MAQKTAVDWLIKEFNLEEYKATIEFAKAKEKEQITNTYLNACARVTPYGYYNDSAEQYYNETYGSNN